MVILIQLLFSFVATVAFAVLTNIPRQALISCGIVGVVGWFFYWTSFNSGANLGLSNFVGAFSIGIMSILFSRRMKMPMIIFNIPSLVPLVPGGTIYEAMRYLVNQDYASFMERFLQVLIIAGAIAMAFFVVGFIERLLVFVKR